ncbi:hypothetical protein ElyMa_001746700 [Elysia marginata]|uniref:Uncharacterized protein n=1 Tax=Elysia marginata TaxID=1093978 RepID=A0AAV4EA95_9GAST|nr:hypothetical protein ElyMa_001746700 [Elysia marginata]
MSDPLTEETLTEVMMRGDVSYMSVAELAHQNFSKRPIEALLSSQYEDLFSRNREINVDSPDLFDMDRLSCIRGFRSSVNAKLAEYNFYISFSTATPPCLLGDNHRSDMSCVKQKHDPAECNTCSRISTATHTCLFGDNHRSDTSCVKQKHNLAEYNTYSSLSAATHTCLFGDNHRSDTSCVKQKHNMRESSVLIKASAKQNQHLRESPVLSKKKTCRARQARRLKNQQVVSSVTI